MVYKGLMKGAMGFLRVYLRFRHGPCPKNRKFWGPFEDPQTGAWGPQMEVTVGL